MLMRRPPFTAMLVAAATLIQACEVTPGEPGDGSVPIASAAEDGAMTLVAAGNIARCATTNDDATAALIDGIPGTVVPLGDNALPNGRLIDYQNCYGPSWGRHLSRTRAVLGNHEYDASSAADGAFDYFGERAGPRPLGYYSFDLGDWHVIVLNDAASSVPFAAGSAQDQWLVNDLAATSKSCVLAMWHTPLFHSSDAAGWTSTSSRRTLWERLYAAGADVVLNGQQHIYERMAPMRPDGTRDDATGIRQFNVGTGGDALGPVPTVAVHPNSEARASVYGVLKLALGAGQYSWEFVPVDGASFSDAGSGFCDAEPDLNTPPVADAGGPYRSESVVAFDGSASSDPDGDTPLGYAWHFGDGATGSGATPTHTYDADGTYTVTLTVTDSRGAESDPVQTTATIANLPPTVDAGADARMAPGLFTLRATFSDPGAADAPWTYRIQWGDGTSTRGTTSRQGEIAATHAYLLPATYDVRVTVTDKDGGAGRDELKVKVEVLGI
jgi:hypothetical protein